MGGDPSAGNDSFRKVSFSFASMSTHLPPPYPLGYTIKIVATTSLSGLIADSGEARLRVTPRTDLVMALVGVWFGVGLMIDAWAHSDLAELETFFTPWHAAFYSGFAAASGWIIWQVWKNIRAGRKGLAAVPVGYLAGLLAIPGFAFFGLIDMVWHPSWASSRTSTSSSARSHLGLVSTMVLIITTPLRSAWSDPELRPAFGRLTPAIISTGFAAALVSLFLSYGDAMAWNADASSGPSPPNREGAATAWPSPCWSPTCSSCPPPCCWSAGGSCPSGRSLCCTA